ncbi:MetQ/NlpA family ABC transporter substrate-binding protein, partial [Agromyces sp. NPDC055520]
MSRQHQSTRNAKLITALAAVPLVFGLASCASPAAGDAGSDAGGANDVIKIGVVGKADPQWDAFEDAAADAGIEIEIVDFG